jgi:hypothetical protein
MSGTLGELNQFNDKLNSQENKAEYISSAQFKEDYERTINILFEKLKKEGVSTSPEEIKTEIKEFLLKKKPENSDIVDKLDEINIVVGGSKRRHKRKNTHKRSKRRSSYKRRTSKRV